jgi:hypothetical protein
MARSGAESRKRAEVAATPAPEVPHSQDVIRGPAYARHNYVLMGVSVGVIVAGFIALAQGSITLAPILLVLGYLVLVPVALLKR